MLRIHCHLSPVSDDDPDDAIEALSRVYRRKSLLTAPNAPDYGFLKFWDVPADWLADVVTFARTHNAEQAVRISRAVYAKLLEARAKLRLLGRQRSTWGYGIPKHLNLCDAINHERRFCVILQDRYFDAQRPNAGAAEVQAMRRDLWEPESPYIPQLVRNVRARFEVCS